MKMAMIPSPDDVKGGDFDIIMECKADGHRTFAWSGAVSGNMLDPRNWQEILDPSDVIPGNVCLAVGPNREIIRAVFG